jgi:hypothetical protein
LSTCVHTLIDAENVDCAYWNQIKQRLGNVGQVSSVRIFGDFSDGQRKGWLRIARAEAIEVVMNLGGSNACDIAIAVAAMDLLHTVKPSAICLVASDRDYAPLALRLRRAGLTVHGFDEAKAPAEYRKTFTSFTILKKPRLSQPVLVAKAA